MCWITHWLAAGRCRTQTWLLIVVLLALPLAVPGVVRAASFDLTACDPDPLANGAALAAALTVANGNGQYDTITLGTCVYELDTVDNAIDGPNGLPSVVPDGGLMLHAWGAGAVIRRAASAPPFRLLHIQSGAAVKLENIALRNGLAQGANGANDPLPTAGADGRGGAIFNRGSLQLWDITLENNTAQGGAGGAGMPGGAGLGGAIYNQGVMTFNAVGQLSELNNNQARGGSGGASSATTPGGAGGRAGGGALYSAVGASITTFWLANLAGNRAQGGAGAAGAVGGDAEGGAVFIDGMTNLAIISFSGNSAQGGTGMVGGAARGGALYDANTRARLSFNAVNFNDNRALGGMFDVSGAGGSAQGGALYSNSGFSALDSGIIANNQAVGGSGGDNGSGGDAQGGAIYACADVLLRKQSFFGNRAEGGAGVGNSSGGDAQGGAVFAASVSLPDSTVSDNTAAAGKGSTAVPSPVLAQGGAVYTKIGWLAGTLMQSNRAIGAAAIDGDGQHGGDAQGGAVYIAAGGLLDVEPGRRTPIPTKLIDNSAIGGQAGLHSGVLTGTGNHGGNAQGGAIYSSGKVTFDTAEIAGNQALGSQGGAFSGSAPALVGGPGGDASGGALYLAADDDSSLERTRWSDNHAVGGGGGTGSGGVGGVGSGGGGAITSAAGTTLLLSKSALLGNSASGSSLGGGGALLGIGSGSISIQDTTIDSNSAFSGGALALWPNGSAATGQPALRMTNTTLTNNSAIASGGALELRGATVLDHLTITGNSADSDADGVGDGGGIQVGVGAVLMLTNTIVALNSDATAPLSGTVAPDLSGSLAGGYNLIGNGAGGMGFAPTDLVGTAALPLDPLLAPPASFEQAVLVRLPLPGSPAINAGDPAFGSALAFDQRGGYYPRISNGRTDIGALEVQYATSAPVYAASPAIPGPLVLAGPPGVPTGGAISVSNTGALGTLLDITTASPSAGFALSGPLPSGLVSGGAAGLLGLSCTPSAGGPVTGTLALTTNEPGRPTYSYTLACQPVAPVASLAPAALAFGNQTVGAPSNFQIVTLSNTGSDALTVSSVALSGDFLQATGVAGACPTAAGGFVLPPTAACLIPIRFLPSAVGPRSGSLTVTHSAGGSPHHVALTGIGVLSGGWVPPKRPSNRGTGG